MKNLRNSVIWITGASSGIGEALAKELIQKEAILILTARRKEELERVKRECGEAHQNRIHILPFDVTHLDDTKGVVQTAWNLEGNIDILINNAGISQRSLAQES